MAHLGEQTVWVVLRGINFSGQIRHFFGFGALIAFGIVTPYVVIVRVSEYRVESTAVTADKGFVW